MIKHTTYFKSFCQLVLAFALSSCGGNNSDTASEIEILEEASQQTNVKINKEVFDEMIQSLPQPIEIAGLINKSNLPFSKKLLVPSEHSGLYKDKYTQALAFGAYGVDLGYINLNDKKLYVLEYLEAIKDISEELQVDQLFDFNTLYELNKNRHNVDSLVHISTRNFNQIDHFLRAQNRGELSVLILLGAWTEGLQMFGKLYHEKQDAAIAERIGEQKVVFENISSILSKLESVDYFMKLKSDFAPLKEAYNGVTINYIYKQPETKEVNGELVIIDKTETKVEAKSEDIEKIISCVETIRNKNLLITQQ